MVVTYGPSTRRTLYSCKLTSDTTSRTVSCDTDGGGVGTNLEFQIDVGGYPGPIIGTDLLSYPQNLPTITGVSGCNNKDNTTNGCVTSGGTWITISGYNLVAPVNVLVSGDSCAPIRNLQSTSVECQLGSGTGLSQSVVVSSSSQFSAPVKYLSFAAPNITGITGCTASTSTSTINCARLGGTSITITGSYCHYIGLNRSLIFLYVVCRHKCIGAGSNFGYSGATVLIGNSACTSIVHDSSTLHAKIRCILPASNLENRPVVVVQQNGAVSTSTGLVSYLQCSEGTYESGLNCLACPLGSFTSAASLTTCQPCENGFYASSNGSSSCNSCVPGTWSHRNTTLQVGASTCSACAQGTYTSSFSQSSCQSCPIGEYVPTQGSTSCLKCPAGQYQSMTGSTYCSNCTSGNFIDDTVELLDLLLLT
jgi:hypothetical protein